MVFLKLGSVINIILNDNELLEHLDGVIVSNAEVAFLLKKT
jgi:hypothetical protein